MSTGTETPIVDEASPADEVAPAEETKIATAVLDNELERLYPGPGEPLTLSDGTAVVVRPLKLKELFAAFKVITRGAALSMSAMSFSLASEDRAEMMQTLLALFLNAFPEADHEFCELLRVMVDPAEPRDGWDSRDELNAAHLHLDELLLLDPEIDDAIDIIATMLQNEIDDIQRLGKKVANAAQVFGKVAPKGK